MSMQDGAMQITFKIKGIELVDFKLNQPKEPLALETVFSFDINLEQHMIPEQKIVAILVRIDININNDKKNSCASMAASCIFDVENLHEFLSEDSKQVQLPDMILTTLNSISLSTVRGLMFGKLMGTYLHNAILPIVDPKQFVKD